jgi:hypothetical protein
MGDEEDEGKIVIFISKLPPVTCLLLPMSLGKF